MSVTSATTSGGSGGRVVPVGALAGDFPPHAETRSAIATTAPKGPPRVFIKSVGTPRLRSLCERHVVARQQQQPSERGEAQRNTRGRSRSSRQSLPCRSERPSSS